MNFRILNGQFLTLKPNYVNGLNQVFKKFSETIQSANERYLFMRGCISISEEKSYFADKPEENNIVYVLDFLTSDINGKFVLLSAEVDFNSHGLSYFTKKKAEMLDNERTIMNQFYGIAEDVLPKIPDDFDRVYWDFNQYMSFKTGYLYKNKKGSYILLDNGQSYSSNYNMVGAMDICNDDILCGTWRPNFE